MAKAIVQTPATRRWSVIQKARNIHVIPVTLERVGDEQWFLLQSDIHWDNPHCDWDLLKYHVEQARERDAGILDAGDFFCAMQGKYDKRANKDDLRPEHQTAKYLDALVDTAVEWWKPYKDLLAVRGKGNHETGVLKNHETDLVERFVERMRAEGAGSIALGGYSGWIVFNVCHNQTRHLPIKLNYHHGYGGGGPVTRGVIQTNRQAVYLADADIVWSGHTHDEWVVPVARIKLNADCDRVDHTEQVHLRTPGYKNEYGDGYGGFVIEKGHSPKPIGAAWLRIWYDNAERPNGRGFSSRIRYEISRAN